MAKYRRAVRGKIAPSVTEYHDVASPIARAAFHAHIFIAVNVCIISEGSPISSLKENGMY